MTDKNILGIATKYSAVLKAVACASLVFLSSPLVYGQASNQISYPVKINVEHAETSSVAPAPELKAPEPVIRPVDQASTVPASSIAKKTKKSKVAAAETDEEPKAKTTTKKKSAEKQKPASAKKTTEKTAAAKPTTKATTATVADEKKNTEKQTISAQTPIQATSFNEPTAVAANTPSLKNDTATQAAVARILDEAPDDENFDATETATDINAKNNSVPVTHTVSPLVVSGNKEEFVKDFEDYIETKIVPTVPGAALAIIADGKIKVLQAYGIKRSGGREPVNTETLFRLASVSKTIGSSTAAKLVQDGLVTWDTTISSVLPDVEFSNPRYGNQLTIRHILSQSTGLPTHTNDNFIEEGMSFDEVVRRLRYVNFICPPGKCYTYQNVAYSLISPIVFKKTGKTYEQYATEKLFRPLGMNTASFGLEGLKATNNYTQPHVRVRGGWSVETVNENYYRINPAAGVNASITDMSRWLLAHMGHNPEVLPPAMLHTLHDKVTRSNYYGARDGVTDIHYGLGWRTFDYRGDKNFVHHGGSVLGFRSEMVFNTELQIGMVMLSNCNRLPGSIIFKFLDDYEDHKQGKKIVAAPAKKSKK